MAARPDAPLILAAIVCERVLQETDGVLTATRIVDRFVVAAGPPGTVPGIQFHYLAVLKRGQATISADEHEAFIRLRYPTGQREDRSAFKVSWPPGEGEDEGVNLNVRVVMEVQTEGLYWVDLVFDGEALASTPIRVFFGPAT